MVQDAFADVELAQYAHVFLPASVWAEKDGCFTNTERRVNRVTPVTPPLANSKPDLWIFNQMAKRWEQGRAMRPDTAAQVFEEMKILSVGTGANGRPRMLDLSGMDHDKILQQRGIQWLMRGIETGTARLYADGIFQFADGKARLMALEWADNNEKPDTDFPFWLNSGRVVEHFHTRTRTGKVGNCNKYSPTAYMEINTDAAWELGIEQMEYVRLVSRRGDAVVMAQLTQRVPYNMVFVPFHFYDCVNRVSLGLLDPHSRQPAFKQAAVRIEKVDQLEAGASIASCERTDDSAGKTIAAGVNLFDPIDQARPSKSLFALRDNEPGYALLKDPQTQERNRYGERIALFDLVDEAISLNINGVREVGFNPNRNKQHAFHFTADNCIGCYVRESACSEKNDLPPHLSFRSVGYVEGGTFPNYTRMNISMACNHCDDPVCLDIARRALTPNTRIRRGDPGSGHLFRLRLLHLGMPVQCAATGSGWPARWRSAICAWTAWKWGSSPPACPPAWATR